MIILDLKDYADKNKKKEGAALQPILANSLDNSLSHYSIRHLFAIFTTRKAMKATMIKVISAAMKLPYKNFWPLISNDASAKLPIPGRAKPIKGITKPVTSD